MFKKNSCYTGFLCILKNIFFKYHIPVYIRITLNMYFFSKWTGIRVMLRVVKSISRFSIETLQHQSFQERFPKIKYTFSQSFLLSSHLKSIHIWIYTSYVWTYIETHTRTYVISRHLKSNIKKYTNAKKICIMLKICFL